MTITNNNYFRAVETIGEERLPEQFREVYNEFRETVKAVGWELVDQSFGNEKERHFADLAAWMAKEGIPFSETDSAPAEEPEEKSPPKKRKKSASEELDELKKLREEAERIIPVEQRKTVKTWSYDVQLQTYSTIRKMMEGIPKLYAQDGLGMKSIVHLHYFFGGSDWFITEYDPKDDLFFGFVVLNTDIEMAEFGTISITEILNTPPIELDFYWKKITLNQALVNAGYEDYVRDQQKYEPAPQAESSPHEQEEAPVPAIVPQPQVAKEKTPRLRRRNITRKERRKKSKAKNSDPPRSNPDNKAKAELVSQPSAEIQFIRRFVNLDGKTKTPDQIRTFINALQRAMVNRQVRKSSPYAKEILFIQEKLIELHSKIKDESAAAIDLAGKKFDRLRVLAGKQVTRPSVLLIRRYVAMHGRQVDKCNALKLLSAIQKQMEQGKVTSKDPYIEEIRTILKSLKEHGSGVLKIHAQTLSGLNAVLEGCGCGLQGHLPKPATLSGFASTTPPVIPSAESVIRTDQIPDMTHKTIGLQGKWRTLFGNAPYGFSAMVYGKPKEGKSTLLVDFAGYLAENHGKVLWVELEEDISTELNPKIQRLGAAHPDFLVSDHLPADISGYDFVVINSISEGKIHIETLRALKRDFPRTSFLFVYHTRKDGKFQGGQEHAHLVSCMVEVAKGYATGKGRFGGGRIPIFYGNT